MSKCEQTLHRLGGIDDCPLCNPPASSAFVFDEQACVDGIRKHFGTTNVSAVEACGWQFEQLAERVRAAEQKFSDVVDSKIELAEKYNQLVDKYLAEKDKGAERVQVLTADRDAMEIKIDRLRAVLYFYSRLEAKLEGHGLRVYLSDTKAHYLTIYYNETWLVGDQARQSLSAGGGD